MRFFRVAGKKDHGQLQGLTDDNHDTGSNAYYESTRHTLTLHETLKLFPIYFGTYSGDGTASRDIAIGDKCMFAVVFQQTDGHTTFMFNTNSAIKLIVGGDPTHHSATELHPTDGFEVDGTVGNTNGITYNYFAIGGS